MDHSRDPCPWVALSDFGGAFCMGVSPLSQKHILPARFPTNNHFSPLTGNRRLPLARHQRLPQQPLRRTPHRRPNGDKSARARPGRQLRRLGRPLLDIRLRGQGDPEEGGSLQRQYVFSHLKPFFPPCPEEKKQTFSSPWKSTRLFSISKSRVANALPTSQS